MYVCRCIYRSYCFIPRICSTRSSSTNALGLKGTNACCDHPTCALRARICLSYVCGYFWISLRFSVTKLSRLACWLSPKPYLNDVHSSQGHCLGNNGIVLSITMIYLATWKAHVVYRAWYCTDGSPSNRPNRFGARSGAKVRFRVNERCDQTRLELGLVRSISPHLLTRSISSVEAIRP